MKTLHLKYSFFYVDQQMSNRCQRQIQRFLLCKRKLSIYFLIWLRTLKGCSLSTEVTNNNRKTVRHHISSGKRLQVLKINNRNPDFYLIFILLIFQICRQLNSTNSTSQFRIAAEFVAFNFAIISLCKVWIHLLSIPPRYTLNSRVWQPVQKIEISAFKTAMDDPTGERLLRILLITTDIAHKDSAGLSQCQCFNINFC